MIVRLSVEFLRSVSLVLGRKGQGNVLEKYGQRVPQSEDDIVKQYLVLVDIADHVKHYVGFHLEDHDFAVVEDNI